MKKTFIYASFLLIMAGSTTMLAMEKNNNSKSKKETATFAGGCFWCTEAIFDEIQGVVSVVSGYSGGDVINPSYKEITMGTTGHAEGIQIVFNPEQISYTKLLEIFFKTHDPTTLNRQGADVGPQYRSAVFYHNAEQKSRAEEVILALEEAKIWSSPIVTEVTAYKNFFQAEDYHQEYFSNNQQQAYCRVVIQPKLEKFRKVFKEQLK